MKTSKKKTATKKVKSDNEYISFSAKLRGLDVRLTMSLSDFEIVSNDNEKSYEPEIEAKNLSEIEFEDIY